MISAGQQFGLGSAEQFLVLAALPHVVSLVTASGRGGWLSVGMIGLTEPCSSHRPAS